MPGNWKLTTISKYIIIIILVCSFKMVSGQNLKSVNDTSSVSNVYVTVNDTSSASNENIEAKDTSSVNNVYITAKDTSSVSNYIKIHSPHKATIYSALIPGLGQVYNKKYWKLPVIYGLTGAFIYAFDFNNDRYNKYKNAYAEMDAGKITEFEGYTDKNILLRLKDSYQRNRDLNVIVLAAVYMLNVIDATVDAHLYYYKITEDVSMNVQPSLIKTIDFQNTYGFSIRVSF